MERSITVKAETVEEAVRLAVSILDVELNQISTEVLTNPGRSLFGLRKSMAEVRVRTNEIPPSEEDSSNRIENLVDELVNGQKGEEETLDSLKNKKQYSSGKKGGITGARIFNNNIEFDFSGKDYPIINPSDNVQLFINDKKVKERMIVKPNDKVEVKVSDELIQPVFTLNLVEQDMAVKLSFKPGKIVHRTLADTEFEPVLKVEATEKVEFYNDINPQQIIDDLKSIGVQKGFIFQAIKSVTESHEVMEEIVAQGIQPTIGLDGDLVMHIGDEEEEVDEFATIDFRESNLLMTVNAGQLIATKVPAIPGEDGLNLLGVVVRAKRVNDVIVRPGKNVEIIDHDIVAKIAGKPSIDWRGKSVRIDVHHEFVHQGEVDLESGNIRFEGDVRISGNVHPSMFVGASGSVYVGGTVTKATIQSAKAVVVKKNVFSTTISVGKQNFVLGELAVSLAEIIMLLERIHNALNQVMLIREEKDEELRPSELNHLIHLLLEKKYTTFRELVKSFIQKVKNHSLDLSEEWNDLANKFYNIFISNLAEELQDKVGLEFLIEEASELVELYIIEPEPKSLLSIPYAINSVLYCSGNIEITSKGLYHSSVTGGHDVFVKGVFRGGEINAGNQVRLEETGSEKTIKSVIRTEEKGRITIGVAHVGTELHIGSKKYIFTERKINVNAFLDEDGRLII